MSFRYYENLRKFFLAHEPILIKMSVNANIMKTQRSLKVILKFKNHLFTILSQLFMDLFWWKFVLNGVFTLRPSDPITTLSYVLMNNFCPCLKYILHNLSYYISLKLDYFIFSIFLYNRVKFESFGVSFQTYSLIFSHLFNHTLRNS